MKCCKIDCQEEATRYVTLDIGKAEPFCDSHWEVYVLLAQVDNRAVHIQAIPDDKDISEEPSPSEEVPESKYCCSELEELSISLCVSLNAVEDENHRVKDTIRSLQLCLSKIRQPKNENERQLKEAIKTYYLNVQEEINDLRV